jgi:hypothetical protein
MMNAGIFSGRIALPFLALLAMISCTTSGATPTSLPSTPGQNLETEAALTATVLPTAAGQATTVATTNTAPSCTVLQDLNLRTGPGTAYRPPIRALPANSIVTPKGFAPQGIPGGSWVFVDVAGTQERGWVSAGSQFISCNVDLSSLPAVAFDTPAAPPLPKSAQTSDPDGNGFCIDPDSGVQCVGIFSDESLFQFQIFKDGVELGENEGVEQVTFAVKQNSNHLYDITEVNKAYCVFGGNGPCNPWTVENGVFKWTPEGTPVEAGEYEMEIFATLNGETSRWAVTFTLTLP